MEVAVDGTWVGYGVGVPDVPVDVALVIAGVDAGVDGACRLRRPPTLGPGVGVSGVCVETGVGGSGVGDWVVVASGAGELAGNGVVAALRPGGRCRDRLWGLRRLWCLCRGLLPGRGRRHGCYRGGAGCEQAGMPARKTGIADTAPSVLLPLIRALTT